MDCFASRCVPMATLSMTIKLKNISNKLINHKLRLLMFFYLLAKKEQEFLLFLNIIKNKNLPLTNFIFHLYYIYKN